jgi:hypothetical protein
MRSAFAPRCLPGRRFGREFDAVNRRQEVAVGRHVSSLFRFLFGHRLVADDVLAEHVLELLAVTSTSCRNRFTGSRLWVYRSRRMLLDSILKRGPALRIASVT